MASVSVCDSTSGDSPKPEKPKRIKKPVQLKAQCWICRAPAAEHVHYGNMTSWCIVKGRREKRTANIMISIGN